MRWSCEIYLFFKVAYDKKLGKESRLWEELSKRNEFFWGDDLDVLKLKVSKEGILVLWLI
jgi:hypothetical protein